MGPSRRILNLLRVNLQLHAVHFIVSLSLSQKEKLTNKPWVYGSSSEEHPT
jgi:hypothetical protein